MYLSIERIHFCRVCKEKLQNNVSIAFVVFSSEFCDNCPTASSKMEKGSYIHSKVMKLKVLSIQFCTISERAVLFGRFPDFAPLSFW
jgi:hypothetical protein